MKTNIRYHGDERRALNDWARWLGLSRARIMIRLAQDGCSQDDFILWNSFAGVEGYPVLCAWERYGKED